MDRMTKEEMEEFHERLSKLHPGAPETLAYPTKARLRLLVDLMIGRALEDWHSGGKLYQKIMQQEQNKTKKIQQKITAFYGEFL